MGRMRAQSFPLSLIKMDDGSLLHLLSSSCEPFSDFGFVLSRCSETVSRAGDLHLSCSIIKHTAWGIRSVHGLYSATAYSCLCKPLVWCGSSSKIKERKSSSELCEQTRSVKEKSINWLRLWLLILVWPSVFVFLFNFKLLHNNFLVWLVSVFGRDLADLLDLWTAGGNFCWNFFFKYSWGASCYCFTREADLENCLVPLPPPPPMLFFLMGVWKFYSNSGH